MITDLEQLVLSQIENHQQEVVEFLQEILRYKTITPDSDERVEHNDFIEHQNFIRDSLLEIGFEEIDVWEVDAAKLESFPGSGVMKDRDLSKMPVLVGRLKGSGDGKSMILNGHYDVVPLGLTENWTRDPFDNEVIDGTVYGRGANDMKGGIAAMIQAIKFIRQAGVTLSGDVLVETVPEEEFSSMGTLAACQRGYTADAAIIPEPTDMRVGTATRGVMNGSVTVQGRAGHAELPQAHWTEGGAVNAIYKANKVIGAMEDMTEEWRTQPDKQHDLVEPDAIMPTVISGGEWIVTYPEKVDIRFDCCFVPGTRNKKAEITQKINALAQTDAWLKENPPQLKIGPNENSSDDEVWWYGSELDESEAIVQLGREVLQDVGYEPELMGFGTLTDCIHLINYADVPTINLGPDATTAHKVDEYVTVRELIDLTKAIALALLRWCK